MQQTINKSYSKVRSKVERIIYYNNTSKWGVISLKNTINDVLFNEPTLVAVGNFDGIYENCEVELSGKYIVNSRYGGQLEIQSIKILKDLTSAESIINFLVKSGIHGISTQNARKIWETFGSDSIDVVLNHPEKLTVIYGIGNETYNRVVESINQYKRMQDLIEYGCKIGMPYNLLFKLEQELGEKALEVLKKNIYTVIEVSSAFSFKQLDTIGKKVGIEATDKARLRACLIDRLRNKVMLDGSTGCSTNDLRVDFAKASGLSELSYYNATLQQLKKENFIVIEGSKVYFKPYYNKEQFIAKVLLDLMTVPIPDKHIPDLFIVSEAIESFPFELNEQQSEAVENLVKERVAVLTGSGGTGKSTIVKALVDSFKNAKIPFYLLTPTGKATRRLEECTGHYAQTIHKFLGVKRDIEEINAPTLMEDTVLIIDESSMVDIIMLAKVVECALHSPIRIIFVGDEHQLPSVQAGNVLGDLIHSGVIPVYELTDIMRQAKDSHIIQYCSDINSGKTLKKCTHDDFVYEVYDDDAELINDLLDNYTEEVKKHGVMDVQVITPFKDGVLGTKSLNEELSNYVNPNSTNEKFGFKLQDKVMQLANDYGSDVFNGEVGVVESFTDEFMYVRFTNSLNKPNPLVPYQPEQLFNLQTAYACTCHKSQGAEFPVIFVILEDKYGGMLLTRKLLYTAMSRGKKKVYVYSMGNTLDHCVHNTYERPRITKLGAFLKNPVD